MKLSICTDVFGKIPFGEMLDKVNPECHLEVDGGVDLNTVNECKANGANVFVAGSAYFGSSDKKAFTVEIEK